MDKKSFDWLGGVYDANNPVAKNFTYWQTVNPFASMFGGNIRVPKFVAAMAGDSPEGRRNATIASNVVGAGLLAAGAVGAVRAGQWLSRMRELRESDNPAAGLDNQLGTTFSINNEDMEELPEDKKKKKKKGKHEKKAAFAVPNGGMSDMSAILLAAGIPIATYAAGVAAYKGADNIFDSMRNSYLDRAVNKKSKKVTNLVKLRAKLSNGTVSPDQAVELLEQINGGDTDDYIKRASFISDIAYKMHSPGGIMDKADKAVAKSIGGAALILFGLFGASAVGSHYYFKADNENNRRFDAFSSGLREYAKGKAAITPISITRPEQGMIDEIEEGRDATKPTTARESTQYDFDTVNKPVSISL